MLHKLRNRAADQKGFTLIELLVVILIIGILAAIAIPSFLNQRDKANDSDAKAQARTAQTAMETLLTDSTDQSYATGTKTTLKAIESSLPAATATNWTVAATDDTYAVTFTSTPTGNDFRISRASDGTVTRTCDDQGQGGCSAAWGGPITTTP
jgi:type IV pilus assembly protein PilA